MRKSFYEADKNGVRPAESEKEIAPWMMFHNKEQTQPRAPVFVVEGWALDPKTDEWCLLIIQVSTDPEQEDGAPVITTYAEFKEKYELAGTPVAVTKREDS